MCLLQSQQRVDWSFLVGNLWAPHPLCVYVQCAVYVYVHVCMYMYVFCVGGLVYVHLQ